MRFKMIIQMILLIALVVDIKIRMDTLFRTGWKGDQSITVYQPKPKHTAIPGFVYGGLIASLVDCHGTGSAALFLHRKNGHRARCGDRRHAL